MITFIWNVIKRLNMADTGPDEATLVGISLTGETGCCHDNIKDDTSLGFIMVNVDGISIERMRGEIQGQLSTVPASYRFLTRQGWPVTSAQESIIQLKHLINDSGVVRIQPDYAKPRIGVITVGNDALGFIFVSSLKLSISHLREAIVSQLGGSQSILNATDTDWMFLDRNNWPICRQQEEQMTVIDIIVRSSVKINFCHKFKQSIDSPDVAELKALPELQYTPGTPPKKRINRSQDDMIILEQMGHSPGPLTSNDSGFQQATPSYQYHHTGRLSPVPPSMHQSSVDIPKTPGIQSPASAKEILISYVRAEASQYALDLKQELENLHFSVYLDVHEIFCGSDWQDSLNYAVSHCSVFVPLVTPRYGETQWTNREVKLADILNKFIVPVSFLQNWPPRCLAIQFATTQFISWKLPVPGMKHNEAFFHPIIEKGSDKSEVTYTYVWERPDVALVAKEIGKRCNAEAKRLESEDEDKAPQLRSYASMLPRGIAGDLAIVQESREGKPLIVISGHPQQRIFASELGELFEGQGYEVWCSLDVHDDDSFSQRNHSTSCAEDQDSSTDTQIIEDGENGDMCDIDALSPEPVKQFVAKADEAGVVVFVLSKAFAKSVTCKEQVFYCETRKRVVPLVFEDFEMPGWMTMLIGTSTMEHYLRENYKESLLNRVKRSLNANNLEDVSIIGNEAKVSKYVEYLCNRLPEAKCVYISGGTQFFCDKSEEICKAIGYSLARQERSDIALTTGGFYGVGEIISKSFYEERQKRDLKHNVWHVLPVQDEQDRSKQTRQNPDKTFKEVPFGTTIFCGDSVRQRETIVSRVFDICILVEGGPGAAHEAEEFVWSDHTVIPIKCTGGAAGGKFKVPEKIFEVPPGVSRDDWAILADSNMHPSKIGEAVARIIKAIQTGAAAQITRMKSISSKRASLVSQLSVVES